MSALESGKHVLDVGAGPHKFLGQFLQPAAVNGGDAAVTLVGGVGGHEVVQRSVKDFRAEAVESIADSLQKRLAFGNARNRIRDTQRRLPQYLAGLGNQSTQRTVVQGACTLVRYRGVIARLEPGGVPRRIVGSITELAQAGRGIQGVGRQVEAPG